MKILKFGGSSLGSPEIIKSVKYIIESQEPDTIVVVSAFQGVTDGLVDAANLAKNKDDSYKDGLNVIRQKHTDIINSIIDKSLKDSVLNKATELIDQIAATLHGVYLIRDLTQKTLDQILSYGERLSAYIISEYLSNGYYIDARNLIKTDRNYGNAAVNFEETNQLIKKQLEHVNSYVVVSGFIGSDPEKQTTTLGRGGSDYTAAIIAAAMDASMLEIWTDVDGFMNADPRMVDKAYAIENLSYAEAMELSHFGAKVVYTPTIRPVYNKNIPVLIKNTFNPGAKGTIISKQALHTERTSIKGISSIEKISLITLQGAGLAGVTGLSKRLFGALSKNNINIIMITQASSEYSISFAINPDMSEMAKEAIEKEFVTEIKAKHEIQLEIEENLSIIAIVGEMMRHTPGISSNLFQSLGRNGINVVAIAQGSSELNISVVVQQSSLKKALNVIHEGFFLSEYKELHLFLVGRGNVGGSLLNQIHSQKQKLKEEHGLKINLVGLADIDKMIVKEQGIRIDTLEDTLEKEGIKTDLDIFTDNIKELNLRNSVLIDCTANKTVASYYKKVFEAYASVVAANKVACSSEYSHYDDLIKTARKRGVRFIYETNVGAGLPVIKTIDDLIKSGDKILRIEAVLSGTLNFIFNTLSADIPLSKAVMMAKEKGFSEPDPRIDLSGTDVVRKILILAREAGYKIEQEDVEIKPFLPDECFNGSLDDFWKAVEKHDDEFEQKRKILEKEQKKWRYVAKLENDKTSVELVSIENTHPAYHLEGSNNIISITTERYKELPLVIKGYGAGAEVTAAGIFADVIRVANI